MDDLQRLALLQAIHEMQVARGKYAESRAVAADEPKDMPPVSWIPGGSHSLAVEGDAAMNRAKVWIQAVLDAEDEDD